MKSDDLDGLELDALIRDHGHQRRRAGSLVD